MVHIQVHNGNKKARLTEVVAGGTPDGDMAGDPCRVFDAADMFFEKK
jgi:hypothetical protein